MKDHRYPPRDIKVVSQEQNADNSFEQAAFTYSSIPNQHPQGPNSVIKKVKRFPVYEGTQSPVP